MLKKELSRSLAVTLTLITVGSMLFGTVVYSATDADWPLEVGVTGDVYYFATHGGSKSEGNWIKVYGGTNIAIPSLSIEYTGNPDAAYDEGAPVTIDTDASFIGDDVVYPYSSHDVFVAGDDVAISFMGKTSYAGYDVTARLIPVDNPEALEDAFTDLYEGDSTAINNFLNGFDEESGTLTLNATGDTGYTFSAVPAGDYVVVILDYSAGPYDVWYIYSATAVEVLEGALTSVVPAEVDEGDDLDVELTLTGGETAGMKYGVVMIKESAYNAEVLISGGTSADASSVTINGADVLTASGGVWELFGGGVANLDPDYLTDFMAEAFSSNEYAIAFSGSSATTQTVTVTTNDLSDNSDYVVLMLVYDTTQTLVDGDRILGLTQDTVYVDSSYSGGGIVGPIVPLVPPTPTPEEIDDLDPEDAADTLEELGEDEAADIVDELSTESGSEIVEEMTSSKASAILLKVNTTKASAIVEKVTPTKAAEIVKEAVDSGKSSEIAAILVSSQKNAVGKILLEGDVSSGAKIVKEMATQDLNKAAERVEEMVKEQIKSLDPEQKNAYRQKMKDVIQSDDLSVDDLVNLFTEIANLPETPSTVAEIFEVIDLSKTLEVVEGMVVKEKYTEVATVFGFLSSEKLSEVYAGLLGASRVALYPYFGVETLGSLPQLSEFTATVELSDTEIEPDETVTITAVISNIGDETDSTTVGLSVDGLEIESEIVSLDAGESTTLTWTISQTAEGTYTVDVLGETAEFTVEAPPAPLTPAEFSLSALSVSPSTIEPDVDVTVTFTVTNTGELTGDYSVEVELDGVVVETKTGSLDGGDSQMLTSTVTSDEVGTHAVSVDGLSAEFGVEAAPDTGVSPIVYGIALVVIAAAAYFYMQSQKE